jgi:beta-mannanase
MLKNNLMNISIQFRNRLVCKILILSILIFAMFPIVAIQAQKIQPRLNQGALLEPQGKIINGAGQDLSSFKNYWNAMHAQNKPLIYMYYVGLNEVTSDWANGLKTTLMSNSGKFQIPQIGLSMTKGQNGTGHYEQDVAAGLYDKQISMFIDGLQSLAFPAYIRIGYEFNGPGWNGYLPDTYKQAFVRITNMIRARGIEVATVWDCSADGDSNFMDYYPGDQYVDWWGINVFSASHFTSLLSKNFIESAEQHHKPVLIGESTPRYVGVLNGQQSWDNWFGPYFTFIHTFPQLKAFGYINCDWSQTFLPDWGDARIEQNAIVSSNFANEMDSIQYLHASSEQDFRKTLGFSDNIAPPTPGNISVVQPGFPLQLNWDAVTDPSGLSHYIVYKRGELMDYTLFRQFTDKNIVAGDTITYAITAMDRAGNESQKKNGFLVTVPSSLSKANNGEFDSGSQDWQLSNYATGAISTMKIDSSSVISGRKSCNITVSQVSGTDWHIQLWQWLPIHAGCKYKITFKAKASITKNIFLTVQQGASPYTVFLSKSHTLTTSVQTFTDSVSITSTDQAKLEFMLGTAGTADIWIDAISIIESSPVKVQAEIIKPRLNQGALLEPRGKIINGAGQDPIAYTNYWNVMHTQGKPLMYMDYIELRNATSDWADGLKANLMSHPGKFQIPQIGLSMSLEGGKGAAGNYDQDVAAGLYDKQISMFIDGLQSLAIPAYVRIGYEFNGVGWNGYQPATYKEAFKRITNMIRARGIEVATVWDFTLDAGASNMNYMDYYPGDSFVDWWAINLYSASHFTDINGINLFNDAGVHHKPVMIGETAPRYIGVLNGQQSWNDWFGPYFNYIHKYPEIKALSYIDWDWSQYPDWSTWGDSRLEKNTVVGGKYASEMDSIQYLHASTEQDFRKTLGSTDNIAPSTPGTVSVVQLGYPLQLDWDTVSDPSKLSHYMVYKRGTLSDYTLTLPYSDKNIAAGDTITYAVSAMDRAGNESQKTTGLKVTVPSSLNKSLNGEFDYGTTNWLLSTFAAGAAATMEIDTNAVISGRNSCAITISQVTGTDWHIRFRQWLTIHPGLKYKITFKAKATSNKSITLAVQKDASPYTTYYSKVHTLTSAIQTFTDSLTANVTDQTHLEFYIGTSGTVKIWIDSVSIIESSPVQTGLVEMKDKKPLLSNYPNPFNTFTKINYRVVEQGLVSLKVLDLMGREVVILLNEKKSVGSYFIDWDASGLEGGIYFLKIQNGSFSEMKKMLLLKR